MTNNKMQIIRKLLSQIEDECELMLLLHEEGGKLQISPESSMTIQMYFEIVLYIMNLTEVPKNTHAIRAYMTQDGHAKCVELYSSRLPAVSENFVLDVEFLYDDV